VISIEEKMRIKQVYSKIRKTIKENDMVCENDKLLIGVSGGADSIFLLHAFLYFQKEFNFSLHVITIDHGLRGKESKEEALFVKKLCKEKGVECASVKVIIKKDGKHSIEEIAREKRYGVFKEQAKKLKINKVITAHNSDDQAETVLMRIIKGTSLKGLTGIPPLRKDGSICYIRPMIDVSKKEVLCALEKEKILFKKDSSNDDEKFFRNTVRKKILPYLKKYNPKITSALCRLADTLREDKVFLEEFKKNIDSKIQKDLKAGKKSISLSRLILLPSTLQKEIVRDMVEDVGGNIKKLSFAHWKSIRELLKRGQTGKQIQLPGKIIVEKTKKDLLISTI
jgi:tRNA(Ile)-lysidine synthase